MTKKILRDLTCYERLRSDWRGTATFFRYRLTATMHKRVASGGPDITARNVDWTAP